MNMRLFQFIAALLLLPGLFAHTQTVRAAESLDTCAGFIDTLPATISTQGVWCLRHDLATAVASGNAITVTANNVTIDCNDFKVGGLAAGASSIASGIFATSRYNTSIRNCNVRGFYRGIWLNAGGGNLVEDNRLDNNLFIGIQVSGDHNLLRRNRVFDTGGATGKNSAFGIDAGADIIDNTIDGVFAAASDGNLITGILIRNTGSVARGNRVRGLVGTPSGIATGIDVYSTGIQIDGNQIIAGTATTGNGVYGSFLSVCLNNTVINFSTKFKDCYSEVGNITLP